MAPPELAARLTAPSLFFSLHTELLLKAVARGCRVEGESTVGQKTGGQNSEQFFTSEVPAIFEPAPGTAIVANSRIRELETYF